MKKNISIISVSVLVLAVALFFGSKLINKETNEPKVFSNNEQPVFSKTADIDNDGKEETINLFITKNEVIGAETTLSIGDLSVEVPGNNPRSNFEIVDINSEDKIKEIAITDEGPSSDFVTYFYAFGQNKWREVGNIPGDVNGMTFSRKGSVVTLARGKILDTWFYKETYELSDQGTLNVVPKDFYVREAPIDPLTVLQTFNPQISPIDSTTSVALKKDDIVTIVGCDNIEWCKIQTTDGKQGWFALENFNIIKGAEIQVGEIFAGLSNAD